MAAVKIRDFEPGDYERAAEIFHSVSPEYQWSADEIRYSDESFDRSKYVLKRYVAAKVEDGQVVAVGEYRHMPWTFHPQKFWLDIEVDQAWQHRGIGTTLYERIIGEMQSTKAITVRASTREDRVEALSFLQKRGFKEKMRMWESRLRVQGFDFSGFLSYAERAASQGIVFSTLEEESRHDSECHRKLYELVSEAGADVPLVDRYTPTSFEDFMKDIKHPNTLPDGYFIAKDKDRYVGLSNVRKSMKEPRDLYQQFTGVLREYRGRWIAMALKLRVIDFSKRHGAEVIKTWNASTNTGILAINQKLGFQRHIGWITFEKNLAE